MTYQSCEIFNSNVQGYAFRDIYISWKCSCGKKLDPQKDVFCNKCGEKAEYTSMIYGHINLYDFQGEWRVSERDSNIKTIKGGEDGQPHKQ